jgi:hypothetical protein
MHEVKELVKHMILLILSGQWCYPVLQGQEPGASVVAERVILFTDRSLYVAGENICFSATVIHQNPFAETDLSKVLYIEIINPGNYQVLAEKFKVTNAICTGYINLPDNLSTGIYYLKAYTWFMRNYGPESYSYNQIRIINPSVSDTPAGNQTFNITDAHDLTFAGFSDKKLFEIATDKTRYFQRDTVSLKINRITDDSVKSVCISVVPAHTGSNRRIVTNIDFKKNPSITFKPEYKGITLTGTLINTSSGKPLPLKQVDLTLLGENNDFISVHTDSTGRFLFSLPDITGQNNLFIGTESSDTLVPAIMIDNDFCPFSITLPSSALSLTQEEEAALLGLLQNFQVSRHFIPENNQLTTVPVRRFSGPFYGDPVKSLNLNDYIPLPVLEDYFNELSVFVKVRKLHGRKYFAIQGTAPEMNIYPPLVLVDLVAVYDIDKVLALSSNNISHIDMINEPYVKGNRLYGGIVSIFSKNNDFAGMDLPPSGLFIKYDFFSNQVPVNNRITERNVPDSRNSLYWNGNPAMTDGSINTIIFLTGDSQGRYDIILNGILHDGTVFSQTVSFLVE